LPKEKNARFWTEHYLYSEGGGIGKTIEAIFSTNAAESIGGQSMIISFQ